MACTAVPSYMLASRRELRERDVFSASGQSELVELKGETGTAESCWGWEISVSAALLFI